jgi:hypothetical protein
MAQNRYDELKGALYEHIREKKFVDDRALLTCLAARLDEWVERLDPGAFSCQRIPQTDFFGMLMANIEMIDEVKSTSDLKERFPEREWREFRNAVMWLEKTRDREEAALVEKTYQQFKDRFAAISGPNSNSDRELGTSSDSKTKRTNGKQSLSQDEPQKTDGVSRESLVEWWPRSNAVSPIALRTSRAILSLAILLLLGSVFCVVYSLFQGSVLIRLGALTRDLSVLFFYLSALSFAVWTVGMLWFKARRKPRK